MGKKIYITENQLNQFVGSKKESQKKKKAVMDYVKAARKSRREEERDYYGDGFKANTRIAASDKKYSRKGKNKFNYYNDDDDE
jgi:hypothetical protein